MNQEQMIALAQGQLEAYNAKDVEKFCQYYAEDVQVINLDTGAISTNGIVPFKENYTRVFSENPKLFCQLKSRIVLGTKVLDEESVTGWETKPNPSHVVAIYGFSDEKINRIWFAR